MTDLSILATQVVQALQKNDYFITTVESCTGGGLSNWITNISGASEIMTGSKVTYCNDEKLKLGVPESVINKYGVYSNETAIAMAEAGIHCALQADVGVGITGSISRPDLANPNSTPGVVYIAVKFHDETIVRPFDFSNEGERWEIKDKIIEKALLMVLEVLR